MKKIFIILSVLSLFVGCASKPKKFNEDAFQDISIEENVLIEENEEIKIIRSILNQTVITCDEWQPCRWYGKETRCFVDTDRTDFTIKIKNTTDKKLYLRFMSGGTQTDEYYERRYFYAELNPKETGLYNIFDFISLNENGIAISFWDSNTGRYSKLWNWSYYHFGEIVKNHSLEIIYGETHTDDGICKYTYNFIEPFECDFEMEWKNEFYSYIDNTFTHKIYEKGEKNVDNYSEIKVETDNASVNNH